ncbi:MULTISPECIES: CidA/LrgA family protein [Pantoea]|nr:MULTISPECIES: CidA/LrgA family protein [Pantoea]MDU1573869.1 CidA/LrgA family protein [Pantoea sp.]MDU5472043.1 CidA/LrgA family protein [Pantoea sp.]MDU6077901.1 CidA/LrgA family protein [Pantoea sp.]MDU7836912.1 CidA/LrgA family protein [Pantoea sp.]PNK64792.1 murein hydrolase regulator LrgA [Pantoea sp. FDAARGOS_194]
MPTVLSLCWRYVRAFVIIYLCLYAGNALSLLLPITIPGSILGMLTLFALLATQILPVDWVKPGCHLLIRYMALLFVPISVGIINYTDVLSAQFGPIVVSIVVSTFLVLTIVGWSAHKIHTRSVQEKPSE